MFYDKPFDEINENDITALIENKVIETKYLEYKESLPDDSDSSKEKYLANIVSFANTAGGVIIFGLKQNKAGEAYEIKGIGTTNQDQDFLRLLQIIQNGIEPRIAPPQIKGIKANGQNIYILKIKPSFNKPHRVKKNQKFYGRNSNGRYVLDIDELRNLFLFSGTLEEKMEKIKINRLIKIKSFDFPFEFITNKIITLHIIPIASLYNRIQLNLESIEKKLFLFSPIEPTTASPQNIYNFEGKMKYYLNYEKKMSSYVQIFRNGIIESVNSSILSFDGKDNINGDIIENMIRGKINDYLIGFTSIEIDYPYFINISLLNIKGSRIIISNQIGHAIYRSLWGDLGRIYNEDLLLPVVYVEKNSELKEKLDYCFNVFYNSDGLPGIPKNN